MIEQMTSNRSSVFLLLLLFMSPFAAHPQEYTRGVGLYPGDPRENVSPAMRIDSVHHRNLALHRPAFQSGCYDYNLTAQLLTDGIVDSRLPGWIVTTTSTDGILQRNEREWVLDRQPMTRKTLDTSRAWLQVEMAGGYELPETDSINVSGHLTVDSARVMPWKISVSGSADGVKWKELGKTNGFQLPGDTLTGFLRIVWPKNLRAFNYPFKLDTTVRYRMYRVEVHSPNAKSWLIGEIALCSKGKRSEIGGPYHFVSAWKGTGAQNEWVSVDLGAVCSIDRIVLHWIRRVRAGSIQVSDDNVAWEEVAALSENSTSTDEVKPVTRVKGRYMRVLMTRPSSPDGCIMSEFEVYGTGGPVPVPHASPAPAKDGTVELAGGGWKVQRASLVHAGGATLSKPGFDDNEWICATVPGTILASYLNSGALPDPDFGDNQMLISDSYFYSDFWYRNEFPAPSYAKDRRVFINFNGINWKAEVFLNGKNLGRIEGAFTRGRFDVTGLFLPGKNVLAVLIRKNDPPGFVKEQTKLSHDSNGGEIGSNDPTFHASVGWDWIPTIRGRNTGIWAGVSISATGPVTIEDPFVSSGLPLPDTSSADIRIDVPLHNHAEGQVIGKLRGTFGRVSFEQPVVLSGSESKIITLDPSSIPSLRLQHPELWWPNGYGAQHLYDVKLEFITSDGQQSDEKAFKAGIREMTYSEEGGALRIWVNGRRLIPRGGNWGFSESMLRYRAREYDVAVRYHKEMNFTMIRNWVGQTGDDAFYDACDRYGIMVWQDFWLANPLDGPDPADNNMFLRNVSDYVKRIRSHPSLALYCGRNEGNPPPALDAGIRELLPQLHPGLHYISNSAFGFVSGGGPYRAMPVKFYFEKRASTKIHSEIGMPNMVSRESLRQMLPDSSLWPVGRLWGVHDFTLESAQYGLSFMQLIEHAFGRVDSLQEWLTLAQWANYEGYRAMFEAQSRNRMGALLWMSHPAWPSMVWQTYDYYFEPTAAYFGCMKACEPIHIQWNPLTDSIEVVNYSIPDGGDLTASMEILNSDGTVKLTRKTAVNCPIDSTIRCLAIEKPSGLSSIYALRLRLKRGDELLSENSYWRGSEEGNLQAMRKLPKVKLNADTKVVKSGEVWHLTTTLINNAKDPAFMVKMKVVGETSMKRILPVRYSDNYMSVMPGEQKVISIEVSDADTRGENPVVAIEGLNIGQQK